MSLVEKGITTVHILSMTPGKIVSFHLPVLHIR